MVGTEIIGVPVKVEKVVVIFRPGWAPAEEEAG